MQPIVTDGVAWSVSLSDMNVNPEKMAEPIEMLFVLWTRVGPRNHVLGSRSSMERGNFRGKWCPIVKYGDTVL